MNGSVLCPVSGSVLELSGKGEVKAFAFGYVCRVRRGLGRIQIYIS